MKRINTKWFSGVSLTLSVTVAALHPAQPVNAQAPLAAAHASKTSFPIPLDQLGAVAGKQYQGDGLSVTATREGARLRCVFQRLEGQVTVEGLWLSSTVENTTSECFQVVAVAVGRSQEGGRAPPRAQTTSPLLNESGLAGTLPVPGAGTVVVTEHVARFIRPGLTEEYTVSMDGVRQDFIIGQRPVGEGPLRVELKVACAKAEQLVNGVRLVLDDFGRKLAYSRLRAVDAQGRELAARLEVTAATRLAVVVDDAAAAYPVRIDPTFSDGDWISMGVLPGADGGVFATVVDEFNNLYIGGEFFAVGDVIAIGVAKWNGTAWSALGSGVGGAVNALAVSGTNLYAGGQFTTAGGTAVANIAKWDGNAWAALGSGMSGPPYYGGRVNALAMSGPDLYAGGSFTNAGGIAANQIAKWDGSAWSALGSGMDGFPQGVNALVVSGTDLYAGGDFGTAGGTAVNYIAKWNGSAWSALGSGMNAYGHVYALAVSGTNLYAGGKFTRAGGVAANRIAKWDGKAWSALGSGMSGGPDDTAVKALVVSGTNLYAGGVFTTAGGTAGNYIAKWDGNAWSALGSGMNGTVYALAVSGTDLYAGGGFGTVGGIAANDIAKWNGSAWSAVGSGSKLGLNDCLYVNALVVSGTDLYAGGDFGMAGGVAVNNIAKWNGSNWSALGSGVSFDVNALAVSDTNLYAAGMFTQAGGTTVNYIAKWNGSAWSAMGSGMNYYVTALAVSGKELYASGGFTYATNTGPSAVNVNHIAKWDGNAWSALGSGVGINAIGITVTALAVSGTDLYAGGYFTTAGGVVANKIAKWDGNAWSALGSGIDEYGSVRAVEVSGTDLYAGGDFSTAGGVVAHNIAKWDGSAWSALGSGVSSVVEALAVSGTDLYAGGWFTTAGGTAANHIAKWDGHAWSALGSGVGGSFIYHYVYALAVSGTDLYAGGGFTTAGDKVSAHIARANVGGNIIAAGGRFGSLAYSPAAGFTCTFSDATIGLPYRIQTSPSLAAGSWTDLTNFTYTGPIVITDTSNVTASKWFYRAVTP